MGSRCTETAKRLHQGGGTPWPCIDELKRSPKIHVQCVVLYAWFDCSSIATVTNHGLYCHCEFCPELSSWCPVARPQFHLACQSMSNHAFLVLSTERKTQKSACHVTCDNIYEHPLIINRNDLPFQAYLFSSLFSTAQAARNSTRRVLSIYTELCGFLLHASNSVGM